MRAWPPKGCSLDSDPAHKYYMTRPTITNFIIYLRKHVMYLCSSYDYLTNWTALSCLRCLIFSNSLGPVWHGSKLLHLLATVHEEARVDEAKNSSFTAPSLFWEEKMSPHYSVQRSRSRPELYQTGL